MTADGRWFFDFHPSRAKDFLLWLTEGDAMIRGGRRGPTEVALRTIEEAVGALAKKHGSAALAQIWIEDHLRHLARFDAVWCTSVDLAISTPAGSDEWDSQANSVAPENFALTANPLLQHIHLLPHEVVLKDSR